MRLTVLVMSGWMAAVSGLTACATPAGPPPGPQVTRASSPSQDDLRRLTRSASVPTREQAVFAIGDLEHPDPESIVAVVEAMDDPVASVRLQAFAALRRIGRAATVPLLSRITDDARSPHVDTVEGSCGRVEFVPRKGDLAAAALAVVGDVDTDLIWTRYLGATGPVKARLAQVAVHAEEAPGERVSAMLPDLDRRDRRLLLEAMRKGGPETAPTLVTLLTKIRADSRSPEAKAIDRDIMATLASMLPASHASLRRVVEETPWPENAVEALLNTERTGRRAAELDRDRAELAAAAFRAVLKGRNPAALEELTQSLLRWSFVVRERRPKNFRLGAAIGEEATLAFIRREPPMTPAGRRAFLGAIGVFAHDPFARADLLDRARMFAVEPEEEVRRAAYELFSTVGKASAGPDDVNRVWAAVLDTLAVPVTGKDGLQQWPPSFELPPPGTDAETAIALRLVDAVLAGRFRAHGLQPWMAARHENSSVTFASAIRNAATAAEARSAGAPVLYARLLEAVEAEPEARVKALYAVVDASGPPSETLWALETLTRHAGEKPTVVRRLTQMLRAPGGEKHAPAAVELLIEASSRDLTATWAVATNPTFPESSREAAAKAIFSRVTRLTGERRAPWVERAIALLAADPAGSSRIGLGLLQALAPRAAEGSPGFQVSGEAGPPAATDETSPIDHKAAARLVTVLGPILSGGDTQLAAAAATVWMAYGLPPDEEVARSLRQAGQAPVVTTRTPAQILEALRTLPPGSPPWKATVGDALGSSSRGLFCQVIELLPAFGHEAAEPIADLILALDAQGERKGIWKEFSPNVTGVCRQAETLTATLERILKSAPPHTGQAALALALERTAIESQAARSAGGAPSAAEPHEVRMFLPSVPERAGFRLERSDVSGDSLGGRATGAGLGSISVTPLVQFLEGRKRLTSFWSSVALAAFRVQPARGRPLAPTAPILSVPDRGSLTSEEASALDRLLTALATRWDTLTPVERSAVLPLFGGASPTDTAVAQVIAISLASPSAGERRRGLRVAAVLKLVPSDLEAAKDLQEQEEALRTRLSKKLAGVFDNLYPPGVMCMSGRSNGRSLPPFPWPPPAGYRTPEPLSLSLFGGADITAGTFFDRLKAAFVDVSPDYEIGLFGGPPDGFAVVARLERIRPDGEPFPGRVRWTSEGQPKLGLTDLLADLFLERPGYFRVIAFVVTTQTSFVPSPSAQLPEVTAGAQVMTDDLAARSLSGMHVFALVYSFERPPGQKMRSWVDGSPSARRHLETSGLWLRLKGMTPSVR